VRVWWCVGGNAAGEQLGSTCAAGPLPTLVKVEALGRPAALKLEMALRQTAPRATAVRRRLAACNALQPLLLLPRRHLLQLGGHRRRVCTHVAAGCCGSHAGGAQRRRLPKVLQHGGAAAAGRQAVCDDLGGGGPFGARSG
jgi:hypothetical protein